MIEDDGRVIRGLFYGLLFSFLFFWIPVGAVLWTVLD